MRSLVYLLFAAMLLTLAGCQPTPEEHFERAAACLQKHDYRGAVIELKNLLEQRPDVAEARYLLGTSFFMLGDLPTARDELEKALSLGLDGPEVWHELGRTLLATGNAVDVIKRVVPNMDPEVLSAKQVAFLGDTYLALGNLEAAADHYSLAAHREPGMPEAQIGQAILLARAGQTTEAGDILKSLADDHPDSPIVWRAIGRFFNSEQLYLRAAQAYDMAIGLESGATPVTERLVVRVDLVAALLEAGDLERAGDRLRLLQADFPGLPIVHYLAGRIAFAQGDNLRAENELRQYLAAFPDDLRGVAILGAVSFSLNQFRLAEIYLERAHRRRVGGAATASLLARTQLRLNKPESARQLLEMIGAESGGDPDQLLLLGKVQLAAGETCDALQLFDRAAAAGRDDSQLLLSIAASVLSAGDPERAVTILESIPDSFDSSYRREALTIAARVLEGDTDAALVLAGELLAQHAYDPAAHIMVGVLRQALGDLAGAQAALETAVRLDPENTTAQLALGRLAIAMGDLPAAESVLQNLLRRDPGYVPALVMLTRLLGNRGRLDELKRLIDVAIQADETRPVPWLLRIRQALAGNDYIAAVDAAVRAIEVVGPDPRILHLRGLAQILDGKAESGLGDLSRAAEAAPGNALILLDLAQMSLHLGQIDRAAESITRYRDLEPNRIAGLATQVEIFLRQGKFESARAAVQRYTGEHGDQPAIAMLRGDVELAAGRHEAATQAYELAARSDWSRVVALRLAGAYSMTDPHAAADTLERWLAGDPDDAEARRLYAQALQVLDKSDAAVREYERLVSEGRADAVTLNNLAWHYARLGRPEAVNFARQAYELEPENGRVADTLGWILFEAGHHNAAIEILQDAVNLEPGDPEIEFHLASALAKSGKKREARDIIERIVDSDIKFPSRPEAEALAKTL